MKKDIRLPLTEETVRGLRAGDVVTISGRIVTGRDRVHKYLAGQGAAAVDLPFELSGSVLYHCGPIVKREGDSYRVLAAGPTTSMRLEMYEAAVIRAYGIRGIMGKGGMGARTLQALQENGCVYFHTVGGAAAYLAERITKTVGVWKLEDFGIAEAMWQFEVDLFPAVVTMDAYGGNIHQDIERISSEQLLLLTGK